MNEHKLPFCFGTAFFVLSCTRRCAFRPPNTGYSVVDTDMSMNGKMMKGQGSIIDYEKANIEQSFILSRS